MIRLALAAALALAPSAIAEEGAVDCLAVPAAAVRVIDGDTVAVGGLQFAAGGQAIPLGEVRVRLDGVVAPDLRRPQAACQAEIEAGKRAASRLRELIDRAGTVAICPTPRTSFERHVGTIRVEGRRLGLELIAEGLASDSAEADWCGEK